MFVIVAYDISDDRRLRRVAAMMKDYGTRVQRSVFECNLGREGLRDLIVDIKALINRRRDRVQIYHLCRACQQRFENYDQGSLTEDTDVYIC